jgi:putative spermidine/putrescine transport system permease protein
VTDPAARGRAGERLRLAGLLGPPLAWLVVAYLGSMAVLLVSAFWSRDAFTGQVVQVYTLGNLIEAFTDPVTWIVTARSIGIAVAVTLLDAVVAIPMGLAMAKVVSPRARVALVVAVTTPLWASYLVKAYAWRVLLAPDGPLSWLGASPSYGVPATIATLAYLWLPYMVLPVFAGFDRVPDSLLEASADLGASSLTTLRAVVLPLVLPAVAAGSIFTFSLSLGDYIAVGIVGGKTQVLGTLIYGQLVTANDQPLAATLSLIPLAAISLYLLALRRTGALENV